MTQVDTTPAMVNDDWIPADTFGARLALVRQHLGGWNVKRAAERCGVNDQSWRNWEAGIGTPRDYPSVCRKIAEATGASFDWLMVGGPLLRSRCSWTSAQVSVVNGGYTGQLTLLGADGEALHFGPAELRVA